MVPALQRGLVGRDRETAEVSSFTAGIGGERLALVIEGELGIGKTRLLHEAVRRGREAGFRILSSSPGAADAKLSFSGLGDLLSEVVEDPALEIPDPQRRALEVALLLRDPEGEPPGALAVALAVRLALCALSELTPVLVAIDDAQWFDTPSAEAVSYALRRLAGCRVAMIAAVRTDPDISGEPAVVAGLARDTVRRVRPEPLSREDMGRLLRSELGLSLTAAELVRIHGACGGNPLYSLEVGRILPASGILRPDEPVPIPGDLRELVRARLDAVPVETRALLVALAAASEASRGMVATALAPDSPDVALAGAAATGILEPGDPPERFAHPLFASVVYADASPAERRAVHRRLAVLVEDLEERAHHLALAAAGPDSVAADALEEAAHVARGRGAPSAAAGLAEGARRLTPPAQAGDAARRALLAADYHLDTGQFRRAGALLDDVLTLVPSGPVRGAALQRLGWARYHEESWAAASDLFRQASSEASDDRALLAALDLDTSVGRLLTGDVRSAAEASRSALRRAHDLGDPAFLAEATAVAASIDFLLGAGVADDVMANAVGMETWTRPRPTMQHPSVAFGVLLKWTDELDAARGLLEAARRRAEEVGTERSLPFILFHLAELECWSGRWVVAEEEARLAADIAERTGQGPGSAFAMAARALVAALRGDVDEARAVAARGLELAGRTGALPAGVMLEAVLGFLELSLGDANRAHRHLGPLVDRVAADGIFEPGAVRHLGDGLEVLVRVGDLERAGLVTEQLAVRSGELGRVWGLAVAARVRGLLRAAEGDVGAAGDAFEEALAHQEALGQPFELARTLVAAGTVRRRDRQKRAAREPLERALEIFQGLGADLWAERTREELGRVGGRTSNVLSLTPTEDRVARMVVDGATNQETAAALFLSVKTVEWNLSRIYRKLGIRSRTELARWLNAPPS